MIDTSTKEGMTQRIIQLVREYTERRNWSAIIRLIGGSRYDLQDYRDSDSGEPPEGAKW